MRARAFSLLEVMVAIAILAVGMTVLLQVQTRSVRLAQEAREMTVATMLARSKLLDCQADLTKKGFSIGDYNEEGNFSDDGYDKFYWECHAYKPDIPVADAADVQEAFAGTGNEATGEAVQEQAGPQGADLGMQFLAPVMSQMSSILGESIRELVVIVRWGEGAEQAEMQVATHVIDKTAVNQVAGMIQRATSAMPGGGGGRGGGGGGGGGPPKVPVPGGGKG